MAPTMTVGHQPYPPRKSSPSHLESSQSRLLDRPAAARSGSLAHRPLDPGRVGFSGLGFAPMCVCQARFRVTSRMRGRRHIFHLCHRKLDAATATDSFACKRIQILVQFVGTRLREDGSDMIHPLYFAHYFPFVFNITQTWKPCLLLFCAFVRLCHKQSSLTTNLVLVGNRAYFPIGRLWYARSVPPAIPLSRIGSQF
jgi:hypothetical protein